MLILTFKHKFQLNFKIWEITQPIYNLPFVNSYNFYCLSIKYVPAPDLDSLYAFSFNCHKTYKFGKNW